MWCLASRPPKMPSTRPCLPSKSYLSNLLFPGAGAALPPPLPDFPHVKMEPDLPELHHLEHSPLGEEHPYQQEPTERTPRQPLAGQPVTLGLVTYPAAAAERVWVQWQAGGSQGQVEGAVSAQEDLRTCWKAALPAFPALQTVTYRLFAAAGEQVIQSEQFTFSAAAWVESGPLAGIEQQAGRILLNCTPLVSAGGLSACLVVHFVRPDRLRLGWYTSPPPVSPPSGGAEYQ